MEEKSQDKFIGSIWQLLKDVTSYVDDMLYLVRLELQLAGKSLGRIISLFLMLGIFIISAWIGLMGILITGLLYLGFSWFLAWACMVSLNLLIILVICIVLKKYRHNLTLPATRRQLS